MKINPVVKNGRNKNILLRCASRDRYLRFAGEARPSLRRGEVTYKTYKNNNNNKIISQT